MMRLRAPSPDELIALSDLCLRSKAVWGYDQAFMDACRVELTLTERDLRDSEICVAERAGNVIGVAQVSREGEVAHLEKLFVDPTAMRFGAGRALFAWAQNAARSLGASTLVIDADPGAAEFYRRMGARDAGVAPSGSIPGRFLPRLKLAL